MDVQELQERQRWSLKQKIDHSLFTIETYISRTEGQCYVAFSGGKDSSVLLDLVRMIDPTIPAVFVNTGNEYPDIIKFVRHLRDDKGYNIIELTPKMKPREVWSKYGFPLISKAQAEYIDRWRKNPAYGLEQQKRAEAKGWAFGRVSDRWKYLIYEPYHTSNLCCDILKKNPAKKYEKETGRHPILGMMASESNLRQTEYIRRGGCNTFGEDGGRIRSTPLAIWTDKDIWEYIKERNLEISEVYYKGADRTGCVGCGFGCQFKDDTRFDLLWMLHPKYYEMIMDYTNNGVRYRDAVRKIFHRMGKELPDESGRIYFMEDFIKH